MFTTEQLSSFRARLEQQRAALRAEMAALQRQVANPDVVEDAISDSGEDGNMLFAHEQAMGDLARLKQTLAHIERALQRIEAGTYSYSEVSGAAIPIERLEALPYATTLISELWNGAM